MYKINYTSTRLMRYFFVIMSSYILTVGDGVRLWSAIMGFSFSSIFFFEASNISYNMIIKALGVRGCM